MYTKRVSLLIVLLAVIVISTGCNLQLHEGVVQVLPATPTEQSNTIPTITPLPTLTPAPYPAPACKTYASLPDQFKLGDITEPDPTITYLGQYCQNGLDYVQLSVPPAEKPPSGDLLVTIYNSKYGSSNFYPEYDDPYYNTSALENSCQLNSVKKGSPPSLLTCWGKPPDYLQVVSQLDYIIHNSVQPTCPNGYTYNPNSKLCDFTGKTDPLQTICTNGETYDPIGHCCGENNVALPNSCVDIKTLAGSQLDNNQGYLVPFANGASYCLSGNAIQNAAVYDPNSGSYPYVFDPWKVYCYLVATSNFSPVEQICSFGMVSDREAYQFIDCSSGGRVGSCKKPSYCVAPSYQWHQDTCTCEYIPG